jgi:putative restriction endonuclease
MNVKYIDFLNLDNKHTKRLQWIINNTGKVVPWSDLNNKNFLISSTAKGIYKPAWTDYAISVKEIIDSPYPAKTIKHDDGSWSYYYYQEGLDPKERDKQSTNRGLMKAWKDKVPVAVLVQETKKPKMVTYSIKGIGLVTDWKDGFFRIDSTDQYSKEKKDGKFHEHIEVIGNNIADYDPSLSEDTRERIFRAICHRRGQKQFRENLIRAYNGTCSITGTAIEGVLEAAHITPYNGGKSNIIQNGILLRADIHTLWDLGLIAVNEQTYTVILDDSLVGSVYEELSGLTITLPTNKKEWPSKKCIAHHRSEFKL